jgi:hypothetical protein
MSEKRVNCNFARHYDAGPCRRSAPGTLGKTMVGKCGARKSHRYDVCNMTSFHCSTLQGSGAKAGSVYGVQGRTLVVYIMSVEGSTRATQMESTLDTQSVFLSEGGST